MKPPFLDEYGHKVRDEQKGMKNAQKHELASHHCIAYQNTGHKKHLEELWDLIYVYILALPSREPSLLKGYEIEEVVGEAYLLMERVARRFNPNFGVPFVLYFRLSLGGHLAALRVKDSKYVAVDELYADDACEPTDEMQNDHDQALYLLEQLDNMGDSDEIRITKAYVQAYLDKKLPRHMVIAGYAGMPLKQVSLLNVKVSKIVDGLIL